MRNEKALPLNPTPAFHILLSFSNKPVGPDIVHVFITVKNYCHVDALQVCGNLPQSLWCNLFGWNAPGVAGKLIAEVPWICGSYSRWIDLDLCEFALSQHGSLGIESSGRIHGQSLGVHPIYADQNDGHDRHGHHNFQQCKAGSCQPVIDAWLGFAGHGCPISGFWSLDRK